MDIPTLINLRDSFDRQEDEYKQGWVEYTPIRTKRGWSQSCYRGCADSDVRICLNGFRVIRSIEHD